MDDENSMYIDGNYFFIGQPKPGTTDQQRRENEEGWHQLIHENLILGGDFWKEEAIAKGIIIRDNLSVYPQIGNCLECGRMGPSQAYCHQCADPEDAIEQIPCQPWITNEGDLLHPLFVAMWCYDAVRDNRESNQEGPEWFYKAHEENELERAVEMGATERYKHSVSELNTEWTRVQALCRTPSAEVPFATEHHEMSLDIIERNYHRVNARTLHKSSASKPLSNKSRVLAAIFYETCEHIQQPLAFVFRGMIERFENNRSRCDVFQADMLRHHQQQQQEEDQS